VKLHKAIEDVQEAEAELAKQLRSVGERHATEPDLYHLGHTLARQCADHVRRLAPFAERYGASSSTDNNITESPGVLEGLRRTSSRLISRSEASGLVLLRDLRHLYLAAQNAEIVWVILLQAARAVRDRELIEAASLCREEAEARGKWLRTRIKESCPQVLASG
jgi:hypothetical protein